MQTVDHVTGESPIVDTRARPNRRRSTSRSCRAFRRRAIRGSCSSALGISNDRVNVGGTQSGQQSNYVSRGSATGNNKWAIDGVDITDMSATGASPICATSTCSRRCR